MKRNAFICIESLQYVCFSASLFLFLLGKRIVANRHPRQQNFVWEGPIKLIDVVLSPTIPSNYFPNS